LGIVPTSNNITLLAIYQTLAIIKMRTYILLNFLILLSIYTCAQDSTNVFIGKWQVVEFKTRIGDKTILAYQRDSIQNCINNYIKISSEFSQQQKVDSNSIIKEVKRNFNSFDTVEYHFISDTLLLINGINQAYQIDTSKQWIMLDPDNPELGWSEYKMSNADISIIEIWMGILGGFNIMTLRKKVN